MYMEYILSLTHFTLPLQGQADPLNSAFHLTYNMVLNLLRVEEINPEYMLERSFYQFQNYSTIPEQVESMFFSNCRISYSLTSMHFSSTYIDSNYGLLQITHLDLISKTIFVTELKSLESDYTNMTIPNEDSVATYYKIRQQLDHLGREVQSYIHRPQYLLPYLQPGRLVYVSNSCNTLYISNLIT